MLQESLQIYLVEQDNFIYKKGYMFAQECWQQKRCLINLPDQNNYGIVIFWKNDLIGNINIQLKQPNTLLTSESLFGEQHWQSYFQVNNFQITEISALSLSKKVPMSLRQGTIIALSLSVITLLNILGVNFITTIQHQWFYQALNKTLKLPFFENEMITINHNNLDDSYYWQSKDLIKIYYLNLADAETIKTYNSFFCYLNYLGINTNFLPAFQLTNSIEHTYSNFRKYVWQLDNYLNSHQFSNKL
ncbi:hypothetical protein Sta7437_3567 [Stanieria cyanosphaera PCC 7437]|uniref:Transmembrane protein n=1 Tax=Stanieria cyanosphaera (strain ATCC 29371 / PCC 7437) TaxID=111780 RepID=K9XWU9_STAC7|nr:hypothetical protein [Stanieria cyanosphaera]AFZ37065.1 hypothetical protein Sta7437_3567 [Stanieria cyanosphaera PCC 7437]